MLSKAAKHKIEVLAERYETLARCEPDGLIAIRFRKIARELKELLYDQRKPNND
jgi:hypothetical protein